MEKGKGYYIKDGMIVIQRELTDLDIFVRDFLEIFKKHSDYLIVSGYVSITSGRTRGTEDVDILVPIMRKDEFYKIYDDLVRNNFWCYQGDGSGEVYEYLEKFDSIRFSRKGELFPNIELIPIDKSRKLKYFEFINPRRMRVDTFEFKVPPIEFEILYKEIKLGGDKDMADAKHLRTFFSDILDDKKLEEYEKLIREGK